MDTNIVTFEMYKGKIRKQISLLDEKKKYVNLLSVYDMLVCERMAKSLITKLINEGFERVEATTVAENACLSLMCLTDEFFSPVFSDVDSLMRTLTSEDILKVVNEYNLLRKEYMGFDRLNNIELENIKKN